MLSVLRRLLAHTTPTAGVEEVFAEHAEFVWLSLQRLGAQPADLEDLLQDVFLVVHRRLNTFDGSSKMTTWLFGICLRVVATHRRTLRRRREEPVEGYDQSPAAGQTPEQLAVRAQAQERAARILDDMPLERRAVFVMFELEGQSCQEIATALEIPVGTVYSRLHTARAEFERSAARARHNAGRRAAVSQALLSCAQEVS